MIHVQTIALIHLREHHGIFLYTGKAPEEMLCFFNFLDEFKVSNAHSGNFLPAI